MCPSYRVTRDERDVTRGRANTLRLAITGQLGPDALTSDDMAETLKLCVSCKALPARMPDRRRHGAHEDRGAGGARQNARAHRCTTGSSAGCRATRRYAARAAVAPQSARPACRARRRCRRRSRVSARGAACRAGAPTGSAIRDRDPRARSRESRPGRPRESCCSPTRSTAISSRRRSRAASRCSTRAGYRVHLPRPADGGRPLCCGRTFLAVGRVDEARREAERVLDGAGAVRSTRGVPVVGLEPSCILGFRDELPAMIGSERARRLAARALLFEEFLARGGGRRPARAAARAPADSARCCTAIAIRNRSAPWARSRTVLRLVPELSRSRRSNRAAAAWPAASATQPRRSTCRSPWASLRCCRRCAGAPADTLIVADGTSCRHQIRTAPAAKPCTSRACWRMSLAAAPEPG